VNGDSALRAFLLGPAAEVAPRLLGAELTSDLGPRVSLRITEVEAYAGLGQDPGSHAHRRRTQRNAAMFGPPGHAYVYFTSGMHWCLNVVAHPEGEAGAVLIRAGEVVRGLATARTRRSAAHSDRDLARGPARLTAALGVTGDQDGVDLLDPHSPLRLALSTHPAEPSRLASGPRTGVAGAGAPTPWRFWLDGDPTVSPHRPASPRVRPPAAGSGSR
jgi:DNA-3-methyladenine glycosylase